MLAFTAVILLSASLVNAASRSDGSQHTPCTATDARGDSDACREKRRANRVQLPPCRDGLKFVHVQNVAGDAEICCPACVPQFDSSTCDRSTCVRPSDSCGRRGIRFDDDHCCPTCVPCDACERPLQPCSGGVDTLTWSQDNCCPTCYPVRDSGSTCTRDDLLANTERVCCPREQPEPITGDDASMSCSLTCKPSDCTLRDRLDAVRDARDCDPGEDPGCVETSCGPSCKPPEPECTPACGENERCFLNKDDEPVCKRRAIWRRVLRRIKRRGADNSGEDDSTPVRRDATDDLGGRSREEWRDFFAALCRRRCADIEAIDNVRKCRRWFKNCMQAHVRRFRRRMRDGVDESTATDEEVEVEADFPEESIDEPADNSGNADGRKRAADGDTIITFMDGTAEQDPDTAAVVQDNDDTTTTTTSSGDLTTTTSGGDSMDMTTTTTTTAGGGDSTDTTTTTADSTETTTTTASGTTAVTEDSSASTVSVVTGAFATVAVMLV